MEANVLRQATNVGDASVASTSEAPVTFEFREVTEVSEVENLLRLRYRVYEETEHLRGHLDPEGPPLLLDAYDRFSRLLGLFERSSTGSRLVGTMRVVMQEPGPADLALVMVASSHASLRNRIREQRRLPLPFMQHCSNLAGATAFVSRAWLHGEVLAEAGRFALAADSRGGRGGPGGLARHMAESALALMMLPEGCDRALINCGLDHAVLYRRMGFRPIPGAERGVFPGDRGETINLHLDRDSLPPAVHERVMDLAAEFAATGRTTLCPGDGQAIDRPRYPWPSMHRRPAPSPILHPGLRAAAAC